MTDTFSSPPADSKVTSQKPSIISAFSRLIRLRNQSGTLLLVLPTLWALVLASKGNPDPVLIAIFLVGAFLMRSAGVVFNDLADRKIDQKVQRTQERPLASGALIPKQALALASIIVLFAFGFGRWFRFGR